jgi:hypothetical protein
MKGDGDTPLSLPNGAFGMHKNGDRTRVYWSLLGCIEYGEKVRRLWCQNRTKRKHPALAYRLLSGFKGGEKMERTPRPDLAGERRRPELSWASWAGVTTRMGSGRGDPSQVTHLPPLSNRDPPPLSNRAERSSTSLSTNQC